MKLAAAFGAIAGLAGALGVAAAAFGVHGLRSTLTPDRVQVFETAARVQLVHALALATVAVALRREPGGALAASGWLFALGVVIFSGSLYMLALTGTRAWGAVTPVGGVCLIAGWAALGLGLARAR